MNTSGALTLVLVMLVPLALAGVFFNFPVAGMTVIGILTVYAGAWLALRGAALFGGAGAGIGIIVEGIALIAFAGILHSLRHAVQDVTRTLVDLPRALAEQLRPPSSVTPPAPRRRTDSDLIRRQSRDGYYVDEYADGSFVVLDGNRTQRFADGAALDAFFKGRQP